MYYVLRLTTYHQQHFKFVGFIEVGLQNRRTTYKDNQW